MGLHIVCIIWKIPSDLEGICLFEKYAYSPLTIIDLSPSLNTLIKRIKITGLVLTVNNSLLLKFYHRQVILL